MILTKFQEKENEKFFTKVLGVLNDGGVYVYKATSEIYFKKGNKFECSQSAYDEVKKIVSGDFLKSYFVVK